MAKSPYGIIFAAVTSEMREGVELALDAMLKPLHPDLKFIGTFTLPLSPTGQEPATHYGASSAILEEDLPGLLAAAPQFGEGVKVWLGSKPDHDPDDAVVLTHFSQSTGDPLERWADLDAAVASAGLLRVATPPV